MPPRVALLALLPLAQPASASDQFGLDFLAANKDKPGVVTLPSGLQYKVLATGSGDSHPTKDSPCECHYEGRTAQVYPDGEKFDSSYDRGSPTTFAPNQVIKGWTEAMQLMVEGDKWEMYIPSDLAYGDSGRPPKIGGGNVLIFTMEIIKIKGDKTPANRCDIKTLEGCTEKQTKYIEAKKGLDADAISTELARLKTLAGKKMSPDQEAWVAARSAILIKLKAELA